MASPRGGQLVPPSHVREQVRVERGQGGHHLMQGARLPRGEGGLEVRQLGHARPDVVSGRAEVAEDLVDSVDLRVAREERLARGELGEDAADGPGKG